MPFALPTLPDLVTRSRRAFRTYLPGSDAWLWPNNLYASAKVIGGMCFELFGFADYIFRQRFAILADGENLDLHGAEYDIGRKEAQPASGTVIVTATGAVSIIAGALFERSDGARYVATGSGAIGGEGTLAITVDAVTPGKAGNATAETPLSIVSGVTGAGADTATAAVDDNAIVGGTEVEPDGAVYTSDLATYRGRILFRKRNVPFGGSPADYVRWCGQVIGVSRVFVERVWSGPGTVRVFPLMDDLYADGIPAAGDIVRVQSYLDTVQPGDALVSVTAASAVLVAHTISGLTPDTTATREAVLAELRSAFRRLSVVAGTSTPHPAMPYLAVPASWAQIWSAQAVANAAGVQRAILSAPAADTALIPGQIATLGTVTFT